MKRTGRKKEWSILGFCAFLLGVFPPILFVFDKPVLVLEIPLSFLYLYGFWALMIVFMAIGARRRGNTVPRGSVSLKPINPENSKPDTSADDYV